MNALLLSFLTSFCGITLWRLTCSRQHFWVAGFLFGLLYFTVMPIWLLFMAGRFEKIDRTRIPPISWDWDSNTVTILMLMVILAVFGLVLMRDQFQPRPGYPVSWIPRRTKVRTVSLVAGYLTVSAIVLVLCGLGSSESHWARAKHDLTEHYGIAGSFLLSALAGLKYASLFRLAPKLGKGMPRPLDAGLLLSLLVVDLYTTGTRFFVMQAVAYVGCIRLANGDRKHVIVALLVVWPLAHAMTMFTVIRTSMLTWKDASFSAAVEAYATGLRNANKHYGDITIDRYGKALTEAESLNVFKHVYQHYDSRNRLKGATLIKPLVAWIPRSWWPGKPYNFPFIVGKRLIRESVSLNSTAMGELYANFGVVGAFLTPGLLVIYVWMLSFLCPVGAGARLSCAAFTLGVCASRNGWLEIAIQLILALGLLLICDGRREFEARQKQHSADDCRGQSVPVGRLKLRPAA